MSASETQIGKDIYEFGSFRVDPTKQLLLHEAEPVPLTPKAFQLLLVLVRRCNEIVTKDELMKAVWPDTFVEETNLSRNIFALRKALGEIEQNRFIITVPGRGYRFSENVRLVSEPQLTIVSANHSKVQLRVRETKPWRRILVAAAIVVAFATGVVRFFTPHHAVLTEKDTVVLADFANSTGDPVFDDTLRQGLAVELEQSPFLSLVSEERIGRALSLMGQPRDAHLTPELARLVCERIGSAAVIDGSISRIGAQFVLGLHAANCNSGETLDDEQVQASRKEDILNGLNQIARKFRFRAGESIATIQQHSTPLAEATTSSLEALKAYSAAWKVAFSSPQDALLLLQRAIDIDPNFAMAYAFQGRLYADIWENVLAEKSITKAYELRNRASDRERFFIEENYEDQVIGNVKKTKETCELWAQIYSRDWGPHGELTWIYQQLGEYDKSIDEAKKAIDLDPDFTPGYNNLAWAYVMLGRLGEAESTLRQASGRKLEMPEMLVMRYYIAFLKGDLEAMQQVTAQGRGRLDAEDWLAYEQASALAYSGHLKQARKMSDRAVELARRANQPERAAMYEAGTAVREAFYGNVTEARQRALATRKLSNGRDVEWGAALALALSGDFSLPQKLAIDLNKRFPEDTYVQFIYLPILRTFAAPHSDSAKELELLQTAAPPLISGCREAGRDSSEISIRFTSAAWPI
ncbi:MAG TPA: winged helix-turn-helix domain-containing protein [Terracidiphilus sp.]|nr:winged helix-turn-helix domain-containing protein [Terracidiphilus sp.]